MVVLGVGGGRWWWVADVVRMGQRRGSACGGFLVHVDRSGVSCARNEDPSLADCRRVRVRLDGICADLPVLLVFLGDNSQRDAGVRASFTCLIRAHDTH